ncbi:MAG TPA: DsbA family protein [Acidimicrobiia bacterium]
MNTPIRLAVWSDFLCPWCYVGAFRMADIERQYGDRVDVQWKSHVLRPAAKARDIERFREYTTLWTAPAGPAAYEARCEFRTWGGEPPPTHSIPAAAAAKVVYELAPEQAAPFRMALFRAYFTEHRTISDVHVLAEIAAECDVDAAAFRDAMRERGAAVAEQVFAEHNEGLELGAHAAPTVVLNDALPIPGAQDLDTYTRILDRMLARAAGHATSEGGAASG